MLISKLNKNLNNNMDQLRYKRDGKFAEIFIAIKFYVRVYVYRMCKKIGPTIDFRERNRIRDSLTIFGTIFQSR